MQPVDISAVLDHKLIEVGGTVVTVATAISAFLVIVATLWISKIVRRGVLRVLAARGLAAERSAGTITSLLHYAILVSGFGVALDTVGIDLAALFAAGAIFAIGLGFAMQNIAQNFVSGVILLVEQAIKPGDIIEVNDLVCRVVRMGIRATIVNTRDGEDIIVPNSVLAQSSVKNYTLEGGLYRLRTRVGVSYDADRVAVREALEKAARAVPWRDENIEPQVLLLDFGDNAVVWEVAVWSQDPWSARYRTSALNEAIWDALAEARLTIAFPQLDLHLDQQVVERLGAFRRAG